MSETPQFTDGAAYERMMGRWSRRVGDRFLEWLAVPAGRDWLDVGCGNGAFTELVARQAAPARLAGIDPSPEQIDYAKSRAGLEAAELTVAGAQDLPFADGSFDAAVMALVIAFVPEPAKGVAEMARVVRAGGTVGAYMWDFEGGGVPVEPIYAALRSMGIERPLPPSAASASRAALRSLWEDAGLRDIAVETIRITVDYENFEDFWATNNVRIGPQGVAMQRLTPEQKAELVERLRERLKPGADGRIAFEAFANAVKGVKP